MLELLIVITIMSILVLIIWSDLAAGPARARDAQRKSDMRSIRNALETYYADHNSYPSLVTSPTNVATSLASLSPSYLKTIPDDPVPYRHYDYTCTNVSGSSCLGYKLEAQLENAKDSQITDPAFPNGFVMSSLN